MKRFCCVALLPIVAATLTLVIAAATPHDQLPHVFAGLIPQGYSLVSPSFTRHSSGQGEMTITNVGVTFVATRPGKGRHFLADSEAHFDLAVMGYPPILVRSQGKYYQMGLEQDITSARRSHLDNTSDAMTGYDAPKETRYPWGWGITQCRRHHFVGAGRMPDDIDYIAEYKGVLVGDTTIKKFKLMVAGAQSAEEADRWAKLCADAISRTGIADLQ